jgi:hypothetical protein
MKSAFSETREAKFAALSTKAGMDRFKKIVQAHTKKTTATKESAIKSLSAAGILTPTGRLSKKYRAG